MIQTKDKIKLLGIFAHPHDCVHALGTCAHHVERGDSVTIVILTNGGSTHNEERWAELQKPPSERDPTIVSKSRQEYIAQKEDEVKKACSYFGVTDVRVLPYDDRPIRRTDAMIEHLVDLICDLKPDVLIGELPTSLGDHNPCYVMPNDHCICAAIVHEACIAAEHPRQDNQRPPHRIARTYYLATETAYDHDYVFVDISDQYENRLKAEMCFLSQGHTPKLAKARMERSIGAYGWRCKVDYAETFLHGGNLNVTHHLPITDFDLERARSGAYAFRMSRMSLR